MALRLEIPEEAITALGLPREAAERELRKELAVALYARGALSLGKSVEMAGVARQEIEAILAQRRIERPNSAAEIQREIDFANG
jgi:predicted HTH domain antitoxin